MAALNGSRRRSRPGRIINVIFLLCIAAFMAIPLLYVASSAFKPLDELFYYPPRFFVRNPTFQNFIDLFNLMDSSWVPFTRYVFNSVFITAAGTAGHIIIVSMGAFALAKMKSKIGDIIFKLVILTLMFSTVVTAIPNYLIMSKLHMINTYSALILPALASPLGLFLMKQFMEGIPDSLLESARIDGATNIKTLFAIVMPIVKPAWLTLIIFSFQNLWNSTGGTFIYSERMKPLPYAFNQIMLGGIARVGTASAVALILMIVPLSAFVLTQSNILQTMASSGIKE